MESPQYRISQGVVDAPPPPLAGSLAAWLGRRGYLVRIVDPRGESEDWSGTGPLWIHLDTGFAEQRLAAIHDSEDLRFFGPALNQEHCRNDLRRHFNLATLATPLIWQTFRSPAMPASASSQVDCFDCLLGEGVASDRSRFCVERSPTS
jgi:hypothetical protein